MAGESVSLTAAIGRARAGLEAARGALLREFDGSMRLIDLELQEEREEGVPLPEPVMQLDAVKLLEELVRFDHRLAAFTETYRAGRDLLNDRDGEG